MDKNGIGFVPALKDGIVVATNKWDGQSPYGANVVVQTSDGTLWEYNHFGDKNSWQTENPFTVNVGDKISAGQTLGMQGNTGRIHSKKPVDDPTWGKHVDIRIVGKMNTQLMSKPVSDMTMPIGQRGVVPKQKEMEVKLSDITAFRKEFTGLPIVEKYTALQSSYSQMNRAFEFSKTHPDSLGISDEAIRVLWEKILDPTSVVKEGEYARSEEGQNLLARGQAQFTAWTSGGTRITDSMRTDLVQAARHLYSEASVGYYKQVQDYSDLSKRHKIEPRDIVPSVDRQVTVQNPKTGQLYEFDQSDSNLVKALDNGYLIY
jgi:hypothetical protein